MSKVYFGNIIGSTLGPIVTGYVLLDRLSLDDCLLLVGCCTGVLSLLCAGRARTFAVGLASLAIIAPVAALAWPGPATMVHSIAMATDGSLVPGTTITHIVQNRHGIVHTVTKSNGTPETILGGNVYDGQVNVNMARNHNLLDRGLVLLAMHPDPERVLVIGLSTGAWAGS